MEHDFVKITGGVYRALDFLPEGDPLKNKAKELALAILEAVLRKDLAEKLQKDIIVLESYLKLAKSCGWISDMNYLIIAKQYQEIRNFNIEIKNPPSPKAPAWQGKPKEQETEKPTPSVVENFSERQTKIIDILKKKERAQVADLIKQLPRITKRTIRRDLDDLLKKKKVARVGQFNQVFYQIR